LWIAPLESKGGHKCLAVLFHNRAGDFDDSALGVHPAPVPFENAKGFFAVDQNADRFQKFYRSIMNLFSFARAQQLCVSHLSLQI
jgi:hypothetical protein